MGHLSINHFFLLITAIIWGSAFVFQKTAMDSIDPYLYSSLRFFAGSFALIPIILFIRRKQIRQKIRGCFRQERVDFDFKNLSKKRELLLSGFIAGIILTIGVNLQQVALYYTQVAKVGFITSFYILIVPFIEIFLGRKLTIGIFFASLVAIFGFYLMSYKESLSSFVWGDVITLISSFFWALHIVYLDSCSKKLDNFIFSFLQFFFCGFLTFIFVLINRIEIAMAPIKEAGVEILYGGVVSVGIGYTLQVFGQRRVKPHLAALIISLEAVFAVVFEMLFLKTFLTPMEIVGAILLFSAVIYSQFKQRNHSLEIVN